MVQLVRWKHVETDREMKRRSKKPRPSCSLSCLSVAPSRCFYAPWRSQLAMGLFEEGIDDIDAREPCWAPSSFHSQLVRRSESTGLLPASRSGAPPMAAVLEGHWIYYLGMISVVSSTKGQRLIFLSN